MSNLPTIGFLGTGVIASALVEGFCQADTAYPLIVSPRNAEKAAALAAKYPRRVRVAADNQQVLDEADWLILAVVPSKGEEILRALHFRPEHKVINLLSDKSLPQIAAWIGPTQLLVHMVPLPYVAQRIGPIALYPPNREVTELVAPLGQIVAVESAQEIKVLAAITALMAPYYTLLQQIVAWSGGEGLEEMPAKTYTAAFFGALSHLALAAEPGGLLMLSQEMTPGGLNEMAKNYIEAQHGFGCWVEALDPVLKRLQT